MFDGVSSGGDLFHQLMAAASSRTSLPINIPPLPSSFTLHHQEEENPPSNFSAAFDNAYSSSPLNTTQAAAPSLLHLQEPPHNNTTTKDGGIHDHIHDADDDDVMHDVGSIDPWSNDEVLALFRLRSTMEIWFPDFTWHHISRKLGELGYKRSAEQCKERFDQESKHLNTTSTAVNYDKVNYRNILMTTQLDEFYPPGHNQEQAPQLDHHHHHHHHHHRQDDEKLMYKNVELETVPNLAAATLTANPSLDESEDAAVMAERRLRKKKKKRKDKFETFKGFCQAVVNKMMAQQEEFHNKMMEDIAKRDEEKIARDEARNKEEMDRLKMEMDIRAKEQAIAADRQATLVEFLKKFTSQHDDDDHGLLLEVNNNDALINKLETSNSSSIIVAEHTKTKTASDLITSPSSCLVANTSISSNETHLEWTTKNVHDERGGDDIGKRWPRDEVLALINLRCKTNTNNSNGDSQQDQSGKGPLWERISQGMTELGYKRNAKRCKEKWENINKYFRKTKDSNKKRSINSRTCPYYQQLSCLYSQGTVLVTPTTNVPDNQ